MHIAAILSAALVAILALSPAARAQENNLINADRPGIADSGEVVEPGTIQLEGGLERQTSDNSRDDTLPLLVRYGLGHDLELRIESDTFSRERSGGETHRGFSPLSVGGKWQLVKGSDTARVQDLGFIGSITLPSGTSVFKQEKATGSLVAAGDLNLGGKWSANPNAGIAQFHDASDRSRIAPFAAVTIEDDVTERIHPAVEIARTTPHEGSNDHQTIVDAQFAWIFATSAQFDVEAGRDIHDARSHYVTAGISYRLRQR